MKILLLEDDIGLNKAIKRVLELDDHIVETYIDGEEILSLLDHYFDLYILDINVPHISGLELLTIIMQHNAQAKVIMISSNTDVVSLTKAYDSGCVDYLKKPFYMEELRVKTNRLNSDQNKQLLPVVLKDGSESLSKKERKLLELLLKHKNYIVTYEMIEAYVYENTVMTMDALRTLVRRLRVKMNEETIRNVIDEGYMISDLTRSDEHTVTHTVSPAVNASVEALKQENMRLKEERKILLKSSTTDPLTGLWNRLKVTELFLLAQRNFINNAQTLSLVLMDLDDFKMINDRHGHNTGDRYLKALAGILTSTLREEDTIGRWGGEEFILLLPNTDLDDAITVATHLKKKITELECPTIGPRTASFGLAALREGDTLESIVQRADEALLEAKRQGKNRVLAAQ